MMVLRKSMLVAIAFGIGCGTLVFKKMQAYPESHTSNSTEEPGHLTSNGEIEEINKLDDSSEIYNIEKTETVFESKISSDNSVQKFSQIFPFNEKRKLNLNFSYLLEYNEDFKKYYPNGLNENIGSQDIVLPAGMKFSIMTNDQCDLKSLSSNFKINNPDQTSKVLVGELLKDETIETLTLIAESTTCIQFIGEDGQSKVTALKTNDAFANIAKYTAALEAISPGQVALQRLIAGGDLLFKWKGLSKISRSPVVAIVDGGINATHPDLTGLVTKRITLVGGSECGHGTFMAGIAGAKMNNKIGLYGINGYSGKLLDIKVASQSCSTSLSTIANGIMQAADNGADAISVSFSGLVDSSFIRRASEYAISKGAFVAIAAGNDRVKRDNRLVTEVPGVIAVGAFNRKNVRASYSSYGLAIDIAAPDFPTTTSPKGGFTNYPSGGGTSSATPQVAATAAILKIILIANGNKDVSPAGIDMLLSATAKREVGPQPLGAKHLNLDNILSTLYSYPKIRFSENGRLKSTSNSRTK